MIGTPNTVSVTLSEIFCDALPYQFYLRIYEMEFNFNSTTLDPNLHKNKTGKILLFLKIPLIVETYFTKFGIFSLLVY